MNNFKPVENRSYKILIGVIVILFASCSKDVELIQEPEENTVVISDFRDTLIGNFSTTKVYNHPILDSAGNMTWVNDTTFNYPIYIDKYSTTGLKLRFGSIPDTFTRFYNWIDSNHWYYPSYNLFFIGADSLYNSAHITVTAIYYYGSRIP